MTLTVAAFDFDKTITRCDALLPFLFQVNKTGCNIVRSTTLLPTWLVYKIGLMGNQRAKENLLKTFLRGKSYEMVKKEGERFAWERIPGFVRPEALMRIHWHHARGHRCVLVSAGLEVYLKPWGRLLGLDDVMATRLQVQDGMITGKVEGRNCFGEEKVARLLERFGPKEGFKLYAYGDSRGDRELLKLADYPFYRTMPS